MFEIVMAEAAKADAKELPAAVRARVLDTIEAQLTHEPAKVSRNRKPLSEPLAPAWELRIGEYRVIYLVEAEVVKVVKVVRIVRKGRKTTEEVT